MMMWIVLEEDVDFLELEEVELMSYLDRPGAVVGVQLAIDFFDVVAYSIEGDEQLLSNLSIFQSLCHQP